MIFIAPGNALQILLKFRIYFLAVLEKNNKIFFKL